MNTPQRVRAQPTANTPQSQSLLSNSMQSFTPDVTQPRLLAPRLLNLLPQRHQLTICLQGGVLNWAMATVCGHALYRCSFA
jgi:membrane protein YqaA with SNARE-associated domain